MIRLKDVSKIYSNKGVETTALRNVNLQINAGEFISITGKSGCGKSSLLNVIGCMDDFTSGEYFFGSMNMGTIGNKDAAIFRNQNIGYVFQSFCLISEKNALDNVSVPLGYRGMSLKKEKNLRKMHWKRWGWLTE